MINSKKRVITHISLKTKYKNDVIFTTNLYVCLIYLSFVYLTHAFLQLESTFGGISLTKAIFRKYLKESCSSELYLQLSFKYLFNLYFILKIFLKVRQVQTTLVKEISRTWVLWA